MEIDDMAHIELYVNEQHKLSFAYPVGVPDAMAMLSERLEATKHETAEVTEALATLVQNMLVEMPDDIRYMEQEEQDQLVFLLCGFLKHLCDEADDTLEAGSQYQFKLSLADKSMSAAIYDVNTLH